MLRNKLMTACSVAVLTAALYGCSSSSDDGANMQVQDLQDQIAALNAELGEGEELTPEALAALIQAKADAEAALADAMIAHQAALAAAAMDAETAKTAALAAAAMEAMTAHEAALAAAAMEAMTAQEAALAAAAMEAMTAQEAALAAAAMEAMTAHDAALAAAAMEAMTAHDAALAAAAMEAMTAHDAALAAAAIAAADMAAADKAAALADAKTAADAAQAMALADAKTAADAAQAMALADAKTAADAAQAMALADAKTAADAAQAMALADAKTAADAAQAMALADAKTAADAAQAMALADAKTAADAALKMVQDELAKIKTDLVDEIAAGALKEKIAREAAISKAISMDENRVGTAAKPIPAGAAGVTAVTATRNAAGMVTVDVNGATTDDVYTGGETTARSGDWNSVTMTKTDAGTEAEDTLVIYTDIDAPADVLIKTRYAAANEVNLLDNALLFDAPTDLRVGKAQSDGFPSGPDVNWTYTGEADGRSKTVLGTFDGVPGGFECTADPCMVSTDKKGKLMSSAGWRFTPASPLDATVKVPDANYAYFGWWLNKPKLNTDMHDVEVFAGGTNAVMPLALEIVGNATYSGPAAGKYVTKTFTAGAQTDASVGHFSANANLVARFGNAGHVGTTIDGSITGFELDDGSNPGWTVKLLGEDNIDTNGAFIGDTEVNFGGGLKPGGKWQGAFYGAGATPADAPGAVAGTFDAVTDTASVIGGFGATKQ